jgi:peptide/nickel transport system ATP-binding protein
MAGSGTTHLRRERNDIVLRVENLVMEFPVGRTGLRVHAVSDVSFDVADGETLGLVGESGCGKSTTGKALMQLPKPTSGKVTFEGKELTGLSGGDLRALRRRMQMIFQDPISSLNPRRQVREIVAEPLRIAGVKDGIDAKVDAMLSTVGIDPAISTRKPHQFSGGQCQRISVARALVLEPKMLICDEPVSALDVSIQAQVLNLLEDLKERMGLSMIFISHDLSVVKNISDRVAVMYLGKICEIAPSNELYRAPTHPYTRALLDSIPIPDPTLARQGGGLGGELPSPMAPPSGCRFRTRCPLASEDCSSQEPQVREIRPGHFVACHHPLEEGQTLPDPARRTVAA